MMTEFFKMTNFKANQFRDSDDLSTDFVDKSGAVNNETD